MYSFLKIFYCIIGTLFFSVVYGQKPYVDINGSRTKIADGYLASYRDSNVYVYRDKVYATRDTEKVYPKYFEIKLPKNIMYFQLHNQECFEFFYDKNQVIFIKINLEDKGVNNTDTIYSPSLEETYDLINFDEYSKYDTSKYILQKIPFKKSRNTTVLKRGAATILLYNIVPKNHQAFLSLVKQFQFL